MTSPSPALPKTRRKIAVVAPALADKGGVPTVALFILRAIDRRPDLEAMLVSISMSSRDECSVLIRKPRTWLRGVTTRQGVLEGRSFIHVGAMLGELEFQRLAKREALTAVLADCDLVQVVAGTPSWAAPFIGLGKPVVLQVATLASVERRARDGAARGLRGLWGRLMTSIVARLDEKGLGSDAVMVENPWMLQYAQKRTAPHGMVIYAPPGVDTGFFHPKGAEPSPRQTPYILSVGRFADIRKNPHLLLESYKELVALRPDAPDLVLAGFDGPDQGFWDKVNMWGLEPRVEFIATPSQDEVAALYRHALCFALSSDEEGFGMVVVEAMASGVPVVSTKSGGPDGIITDGVDGYLVERDDPHALADRLARLTGDAAAAQEMGRRARLTVEERYADGVAGQRYLDAYDKLLPV